VVRQAFGEGGISMLGSGQTRKGETGRAKSRACSIIFFDIKGIVHKKFVLAKQSNLHTTVTFYGDCVKICEDFATNSGNKTGWCMMTTHCPTFPFLPGNF
jgi:hypothetical protein